MDGLRDAFQQFCREFRAGPSEGAWMQAATLLVDRTAVMHPVPFSLSVEVDAVGWSEDSRGYVLQWPSGCRLLGEERFLDKSVGMAPVRPFAMRFRPVRICHQPPEDAFRFTMTTLSGSACVSECLLMEECRVARIPQFPAIHDVSLQAYDGEHDESEVQNGAGLVVPDWQATVSRPCWSTELVSLDRFRLPLRVVRVSGRCEHLQETLSTECIFNEAPFAALRLKTLSPVTMDDSSATTLLTNNANDAATVLPDSADGALALKRCVVNEGALRRTDLIEALTEWDWQVFEYCGVGRERHCVVFVGRDLPVLIVSVAEVTLETATGLDGLAGGRVIVECADEAQEDCVRYRDEGMRCTFAHSYITVCFGKRRRRWLCCVAWWTACTFRPAWRTRWRCWSSWAPPVHLTLTRNRRWYAGLGT